MTMLFNLNWRNDGGMVMQEPSISHITSQLRTQPSVQLSHTGSSGSGPKQTVIHISQDMILEDDEVRLSLRNSPDLCNPADASFQQYQHEKASYASIDHKQAAAV
jgi:hypothetical protein